MGNTSFRELVSNAVYYFFESKIVAMKKNARKNTLKVDKMLASNNQPENSFKLRQSKRLQPCQNIRSAFKKMEPDISDSAFNAQKSLQSLKSSKSSKSTKSSKSSKSTKSSKSSNLDMEMEAPRRYRESTPVKNALAEPIIGLSPILHGAHVSKPNILMDDTFEGHNLSDKSVDQHDNNEIPTDSLLKIKSNQKFTRTTGKDTIKHDPKYETCVLVRLSDHYDTLREKRKKKKL